MFKFDLRDTVKDEITGFTGVVIGRTEWLNGCIRYIVQSTKLKDGKITDGENIDEDQLVLVKKGKSKAEKPRTGGPFPSPQMMRNPKR